MDTCRALGDAGKHSHCQAYLCREARERKGFPTLGQSFSRGSLPLPKGTISCTHPISLLCLLCCPCWLSNSDHILSNPGLQMGDPKQLNPSFLSMSVCGLDGVQEEYVNPISILEPACFPTWLHLVTNPCLNPPAALRSHPRLFCL